MSAIIDFAIVDAFAAEFAEVFGDDLVVRVNVGSDALDTSALLVRCNEAEPLENSGPLLMNVSVTIEIILHTNFADENTSWETHQARLGKLYNSIFNTDLLDNINQRLGSVSIFAIDFKRRTNEVTERAWVHSVTLLVKALENIKPT